MSMRGEYPVRGESVAIPPTASRTATGSRAGGGSRVGGSGLSRQPSAMSAGPRKGAKGSKPGSRSGKAGDRGGRGGEEGGAGFGGGGPNKNTSDPCIPNIPGPNMFKLKNLVGYIDHDIAKWKEPAYSMTSRKVAGAGSYGPGPSYHVGDTTRHGPKTNIAYTMGHKYKSGAGNDVPSPAAYSPEKHADPRFRRPPSASLKSRHYVGVRQDIPSPAEYKIPGGMGATHPSIPSAPTAVLTGRAVGKAGFVGPAPNRYTNVNMDVTKKSAPMATMGQRTGGGYCPGGPGPGAYNPKSTNTRTPPAYSFGTKHSKCLGSFKENSQSDINIC